MKVKDLIVALSAMPQNAEVMHLWDGAAGSTIEHVWLARTTLYEEMHLSEPPVITSDYSAVCYHTEQRPIGAPTQEEDPHWQTPKDPNGDYWD